MNLPDIPFLKRNKSSEYILVLLLRQEKANAVIVEKQKNSIRVLNTHEEFFSSDLENATGEEWLDILDTAISRAEEKLPPSVETHQTIFGLPNSWVEDKQIKKEYLSKLKHASDELDLKPIGFIEIPEAIAHLIKEKEGAPISALLAEIGKKHVVVSLVKAGNILVTKTAPVEESPVLTVDTLLKKFTDVDILPPRLIIYNGKDIEDLTQSFISHRWSKSIPFVRHMPQVSVLEKGFDVTAVVTGAAEQLGVTLVGASDLLSGAIKTLESDSEHPDETSDTPETLDDDTDQTPLATEAAAAFGFVIGKDINEVSDEEADVEETKEEQTDFKSDNLAEVDENFDSEDEADDRKEPEYAAPPSELSGHNSSGENEFEINESKDYTADSGKKLFGVLPFSFPPVFSSFLEKLPGNNKIKHKGFLLIPLFLVVLIILGVLYTSMVKATIEVKVRTESIEKEEEILFVTSGESDFADNIIKAKTTSVEIPGELSTRATGEEETGEKAKGTVTIFNSSTSKKELAAGTVITSSNNLDFVLDKEVIIASASGDIFSGIESGTAKVPVTAANIGKEYNVPSSTTFDIDDNNLAARNDEAFSGGTLEEITVVSANDIAKLTKDLPNSLKQDAENQLGDSLGRDEILLTVFADFSPGSNDFSNTEGEEATNVTLSSDVEFVGIFYDRGELIEYTKTLIKDDISDDLTLDESDIDITVNDIEEEDGDYLASLSIEAKLIPNIDVDSLKGDFEGKSFSDVNSRLERLPQVISSNITLFPPIPFLPQILPRQAKNIEIVVSSNE